jgi:phosphohistidine phosphatase
MPTLYLVRHAIAEEQGPDYPDDTKRPLTRRGRERMRRGVAGLGALRPGVELILTSPLVRAVHTAEILSSGLDDAPIEALPALAPGHSPRQVAAALAEASKADVIALVGHEPGLGKLACWLVGCRRPIPFRKGGIARIDVKSLPPAQNGTLIWHATPRLLRSLR